METPGVGVVLASDRPNGLDDIPLHSRKRTYAGPTALDAFEPASRHPKLVRTARELPILIVAVGFLLRIIGAS